jgi:hypothetical protein
MVAASPNSPDDSGQAEIQDFYVAIVRNEEIFRFQVAMGDALFVRCRESARDLQSIVNRSAGIQWPGTQPLAQSLALQQFSDYIR